MTKPPIGCRGGISPQKTMLSGTVPEWPQYWAGRAGDSPFAEGQALPPGTDLPRPVLAWFHPDVPPEPAIPFEYRLLHVDRDLIVVDKPHFLPTTSNGRIVRETVQTRLRVQFGEDDIVPLHRLDRLTSGVVICSRRRETRSAYQRIFLEGKAEKWYRAIVKPPLHLDETVTLSMRKIAGQRQVVVDPDGTSTVTHVYSQGPWVDLVPRTGHTHQLRVLMNYLGHPIVGDDTYPRDKGLRLYDFRQPLLLQHRYIHFEDPLSGARREFVSLQSLGSKL